MGALECETLMRIEEVTSASERDLWMELERRAYDSPTIHSVFTCRNLEGWSPERTLAVMAVALAIESAARKDKIVRHFQTCAIPHVP